MRILLRTICIIAMFAGIPRSMASEHKPPFSAPGLDSTQMSVVIEAIDFGKKSNIEYNSQRPLIPASITKAVTTACVLTLFGPDAAFTTTVDLHGTIKDGVLKGNIVVSTTGDPSLGSRYNDGIESLPAEISQGLKGMGITTIEGSVLVKWPNRHIEPAPEGWEEEDLSLTYGATFHPSTYADNCFELSMPGRQASPPVPDLKLTQRKAKRHKAVKAARSNNVTVYSRGRKRARFEFPNSSPDLSLQADIILGLKNNGITVKERKISLDSAPSSTLLIHRSASYADIMTDMMHRSDNLYAEGMLMTLAPWGKRTKALETERSLLSEMGVNQSGMMIEDGSGLSRNNRITARAMADMLKAMAAGDQSDAYIATFPRVGMEGTVKRLLAVSDLTGLLKLKSGSMKGVRCYAGYKINEQGQPTHVVVIMVNGFKGRSIELKNAIERLLLNEFS